MEQTITFREKSEIVSRIDRLADNRGSGRSALIREFIRRGLEQSKEISE